MSDDYPGDPFADPDDPAAREREERRREREEKRRRREAKRGEKEAAKAAKEKPAPVPEPAAPADPPAPPRTPEEEFWDEDPEPAPEPSEPQKAAPAKPAEPVAAATPAAAGDPTPTPTPEAPIEQSWDKEPPSSPDRDVWGEEGDPGKARTARRGDGSDGGGVPGAPARKLHPFRIAGVIVLFLALWFLYALFQPFHSDGSDEVQVKIPKGASVSEVGDLLIDEGVIDDPILPIGGSTLFQMRVTIAGKRSSLYPGRFTLTESMSYGSAIDALSTAPVKRTVTVTVPEGYARPQTAQLVEEVGVPGSYTQATVKSKFLDPAEYGGKGARDLEGFLFPNTYELKPKAPAADLVELQLKDFKRQIEKVDMSYAKSKNLTVFDVLIIASMIEDEAGVASQRKLVAAVIYNRLKEGRPLGIDATTRFATGNYTEPLTESELNEDSPYNTRENIGLPPGPINSPGLEAIQAAAHPAKKDFIFYVTEPGACGKLAFSNSEAEWEADVERYETAREAAGGQNPDTCEE